MEQLVCSGIHSYFALTVFEDLKFKLSACAYDLVHYSSEFKAKDIMVLIYKFVKFQSYLVVHDLLWRRLFSDFMNVFK